MTNIVGTNMNLVLSLFCALFFPVTISGLVIQDLRGTSWIAHNQNESIKVGATVPGSIYTDLMTAGQLKGGHIYANFNDLDYRWVAWESWTYARNFDVEESVLKQDQVFLTAYGLDTIGRVWLNGHELGSVENMFVRYRWSVKSYLKATNNSLKIAFESAPLYGKLRHLESVKHSYPIPPECPPEVRQGECYVNYLRKMQASFAWDWGPAFPTQGIWRPITLEAYNQLNIRSVSVGTIARSLKDNLWTLNTTVFLESSPSASITSGKLLVELAGTTLTEKQFSLNFSSSGEASVNVIVDVPKDKFPTLKPWFPNGMGEQNLYALKVAVSNEKETTSKSIKIGFRTVELSQEKLPFKGPNTINAFYYKINNVTMFTKGTNWIPAHVLFEAITDEYLTSLLRSVKEANMNMVRVWGGGYYESDRFYELADQLGVLVFQDFMFSSSMYPGDDAFMANVAVEVRQQTRRLQHHASLVAWSGNNENEGNVADPYWAEIKHHWDQYKADYLRLTINVTMAIVQSEDGTRPFLSSCPSSGVADAGKQYLAHQDPRAGDLHFYIGDGNAWDWRRYPSAKFVSEYGFQSLSSVGVLQHYLDHAHLTYPLSSALQHRQRCCDNLYAMMKEQFRMPAAGNVSALDDWVYLSQAFQAMSVKIESEFFRRNRRLNADNGEGFTMGALIWQLNEIWPGFSWSSLEFGTGKWKLLHYFIRDFFDNTLVDIYEDGDQLKVAIVRDDHLEFQKFTITLNVYNWTQKAPVHSEKFDDATQPFSVNEVFDQTTADYLAKAKCTDRTQCFIEVIATNGNVTRTNFVLLSRMKDAKLSKATITAKVTGGPVKVDQTQRYIIELDTDHPAPFVALDLELGAQFEGHFSHNGFLLTDKKVVTFDLTTKGITVTPVELSNLLKIKTITSVKV